MKTLFTLIGACCVFAICNAQVPVPIPGSYTVLPSASLCSENPGFAVHNLDIDPIVPPSNFTLSLQIYVVTSITPTVPPYPANWPGSYPDCNSSETGIHPILLNNCTVSSCTLSPQQPLFNTTTNTFDWEIDNCLQTNIEEIRYGIYLDCSLFSLLGTQNNSLYLVQEWFYKDLNGTLHPFPTQPQVIPVTYPNFSYSNLEYVDANYNNGVTQEWVFSYKNIGTSDANILVNYSIDGCDEYNLGNVSWGVADLQGNVTNWDNLSANEPVFVPMQQFLFIKQEVVIDGCATDCGPIAYPPPPINAKKVHFSWRCNYQLPNDYCEHCYREEYLTELNFQLEQPTFTVTRTIPDEHVALQNTTCSTTTPWKIKIENTSLNTEIPEIVVDLSNVIPTALSLIDESSLGFDLAPAATNCNASQYSFSPSPVSLSPPDEVLDCAQTLNDPLSSFFVTVTDLKPGQFVTFQFDEFHCCSEHTDLDGQIKFFNQWQLSANGTTICGNTVYPDINEANSAFLTVGTIPGTGGISGYSTNSAVDLNLNLNFSNPHGHTVVPKTIPPQAPPYYATGPLDYEIDVNSLFGDINDQQALGFSDQLSQTISGIIKVEIRILDAGLLLTNPAHAYFEVFNGSSTPIQWHNFEYYNLACDPSAYTGTLAPCTTNASGDIPCEAKTYCLYFRISDLISLGFSDPADVFIPNLNGNANNTEFKFSLYPCCTSAPTTNFEVAFSLMRNENCATFSTDPTDGCDPVPCFIPLSTTGSHTTVHCPGCLAPGAIVDNYRMERSTLGYPDELNDRHADNFTAITYATGLNNSSPTYPEFDELKLDQSVYGDQINDLLISHFEDGYYSLPQWPGYTYQMMKDSPFNIILDHLQIYRTFPFSGSDDFDVQVTGFDFYIDVPGSTYPNCINGNDFYTQLSQTQNPTAFFMSVDFSQTSTATEDMFFERKNIAPDDNNMLFTFSTSDLNALLSSAPTGVYVEPGLAPSITYEAWQVYRLRVRYKVCGNFHDPSFSTNHDHWKKISDVTSYMYLTGEEKVLDDFLIPNINPMAPAVKMPDDLPGLTAINVTLNPSGTCFGIPSTCDLASQPNLGDPYCFICEPSGGFHSFYSTDLINRTIYNSNFRNDECSYDMTINVINSHQKLTDGVNNVLSQIFPYEWKPVNVFPFNINVSTPLGWEFGSISSNNVQVQVSTRRPNNVFTSPITFNYSGSPTNFDMDIDDLLTQIGESFHCMQLNPTEELLIGDEYQHLQLIIPVKPTGNDCATSDSPLADSTESVISFVSNEHDCSQFELDCSFSGQQNNNPLPFPRWFIGNNPNLSGNIVSNPISASSTVVDWDFTFTNTAIGPPNHPTTNVKNIYISIPDGITYLSNWRMDYTISGNYPVWNSPLTTVNGSITSPDNNNYFWIIPETLYEYLPPNSTITGKIYADYTECTDPVEVEFVWGWNCVKETQDPVDPADLCLEVPSDPLHIIENETTLLAYNPSSSIIPPNYIACDNNYTIIRTCFKNTSMGELKPNQFTISNIGNIALTPGWFTITSCGGNSTYNIPLSGPLGGTLEVTNGNGFMQSEDCFCIDFRIQPLCNFGDLQLPTVIINWENYCGDPGTTPQTLPSIPPNPGNPTMCTNCFMVEKTALNTNAIASGTEPITFEITVSGNNAPGTPSPKMKLWDDFPQWPSVFTPIGFNIFGSGGQANAVQLSPGAIVGIGSLTYQVTGTITSTNPFECNTAALGDNSFNFIDDDEACIDILPNCLPHYTEYAIQPFPGQTSISLTDLLNNDPNVFNNNSSFDVIGTFVIDQSISLGFENFVFEPGAQIVVNSGVTLTMSRCTLQACTKMWKGIWLETNSNISLRHCSINDAQYGIRAKERNTISVNSSDFISDYIGIYIPSNTFVQGFNNSTLWVADSRFVGNSLHLPYQNQKNYLDQLPAIGTQPFAGILAYRMQTMQLGHDPLYYGANEFLNLSNGIIGQRSQLIKLKNCLFTNITPDPLYTSTSLTSFGNSYNGSAIYGNGFNTSWEIEQTGYGINGSDPVTFSNCRYGIYAEQIKLNSSLNKMELMVTGYRARSVKTGVNIHDNFIDANEDGIQMLHCDNGNEPNSIYANTITFGDLNSTGSYAGINVLENNTINLQSRVHDNQILFRPGSVTARFGIIAMSATQLDITKNRITQAFNGLEWDGIHIDDCYSGLLSCNYIESQGPLPVLKSDHSAIEYVLGDDPIISCNFMLNTPNGIYMKGSYLNLSIETNNFNNHFYGLRYGANTIGQFQDKKGNLWDAITPPVGLWQAINENQSLNSCNDYYTVNPFSTNPAPPTGKTYEPVFYAAPPLPVCLPWFQHTSDDNIDCDAHIGGDDCNNLLPRVMGITELDKETAKGKVLNDPFTEETNWMLSKNLYTKLENKPELRNDNLMKEFYANIQNTVIDELKHVQNAREKLFLTSSNALSLSKQYEDLADLQESQLYSQLESLNTAYENGGNTESILARIDAIQQTIAGYNTKISEINEPIRRARITEATTISGMNNSLSTQRTIEDNERIVNDIYLSTLGSDVFEFNDGQLSELRFIANQCPLSGGGAVIRARSLLYLVDPVLYYNDSEICGNGNQSKQTSETKVLEPLISLFPNPANDLVTLEYEFVESAKLKLKLFSATGKMLMQKDLPGGKNSMNISTVSYTPGIYYVELIDEKGVSYSKKLAVIR